MQLPASLLDSLESVRGFDKEAFIRVHESGQQLTSIRFNPFKRITADPDQPGETGLKINGPVPWARDAYFLSERPSFTFDPFFHAGSYYVQEASSMFLEQTLIQKTDGAVPLKVLDLCAAPGGKSTQLLSLLSPGSVLVSNELIRSRVNILRGNLVRWGSSRFIMTNNDARDFQRLENYFDVIVVDAPCSGSGLFRKDPEAINEWSPENVTLCSRRQQRILADVLPALKQDGLLIYSTCSFSPEEDEEICSWLANEFKLNHEELNIDESWGITPSDFGYRFWPDRLLGEGFFIAVFSKTDTNEFVARSPKKSMQPISKNEEVLLEKFIDAEGMLLLKRDKTIRAFPESLSGELNEVASVMHVRDFGTSIGELIRDRLIPDHGLAMSHSVQHKFPPIEVEYNDAIQFLKKKELSVKDAEKGWHIVNYKGAGLGWVNVVPGRINNYYPKELRILKDL